MDSTVQYNGFSFLGRGLQTVRPIVKTLKGIQDSSCMFANTRVLIKLCKVQHNLSCTNSSNTLLQPIMGKSKANASSSSKGKANRKVSMDERRILVCI